MQIDFHYYATYAAAFLAGYTHEESLDIAYSAQLVDVCSRSFLSGLKAPLSAATTQLQLELVDARTDIVGLQDITRIWASFHFLPKDLKAYKKHCGRHYLNKYRLICGPNGELLKSTVELAKGKSFQAAGIAMHVLADTWAHANFAGTPSLVINNTNYHFYEIMPDGSERAVKFIHSPGTADDIDRGVYVNSLYQSSEHSIMNLGHGRAGHLPDYGFMRFKYLPAWGEYEEILKDNPADYYYAFCQMVYALRYLKGGIEEFETDSYAFDIVEPFRDKIQEIISKRQDNTSAEWKAFGEELSSFEILPFDSAKYAEEYINASEEAKDETFLGRFILAALSQKSMVTNKIYKSGNLSAGFSVDFLEKGFRGISDFKRLLKLRREGEAND